MFQYRHRTPVCHRGRDGKQKAGTRERNGSQLTSHNASLSLRLSPLSTVQLEKLRWHKSGGQNWRSANAENKMLALSVLRLSV